MLKRSVGIPGWAAATFRCVAGVLPVILVVGAYVAGCIRAGQVQAAGPVHSISDASRVDIVQDPVRDLLYISNSNGTITRYDLATNAQLSSWNLGGSLCGMDISPDGNTLVVADTTTDHLDVVNLITGVAQQVSFSNIYGGGAFTAAFANNNNVMVAPASPNEGSVPLMMVNLSAGTTAQIGSILPNSMLVASADHAVIANAQPNDSGGPIGSFNVASGSFTGSAIGGWFTFEIAPGRGGSQYAVPTYDGTYIYNRNFGSVGLVGTYAFTVPIGAVYSPTSNTVYFSWYSFEGPHPMVDAYSTTTLTETAVVDSSTNSTWVGNHAFVTGRLKISADGTQLYSTIAGGVNVYNVSSTANVFAWNVGTGGSWGTTANWTAAGPATGVGYTADFGPVGLSANATVTLDGNRTIGYLSFADSGGHDWTLSPGSGGTLTLNVLNGAPMVTVTDPQATLNLALAGSQGLSKCGSGALLLNGAIDYTGLTTVCAGTLTIGGASALGPGGNYGSPISVFSNGCTFNYSSSAAQTLSGTISGSGGLVQSGNGVLTLSASNTYTGPTTINQGELLVNGPLASPVTVNAGGILGGTGSLGSVTVSHSGQIAPGSPLGTLSVAGSLVLASGAMMDYDLDKPGGGDMLSCGTLVVGSPLGFSNFDFTHTPNFGPGAYKLIEATSLPGGVLSGGTSGSVDGYPANLAVSGNYVVLNVVPEPGTASLLRVGVIALLGWGWRRRKRPARGSNG